ncbi:MAG TPA: hypothetical protein VFC65_17850 [Prolixibacteraceae bacterium]|nr:hypothetical protein [Prolixibacteraceae bacterium]
MNEGWVVLQRQIMDWQWYNDPNTFRLFIHILLKVTHKPYKWMNVELLPGQMVTGRKALANDLKLSEQEIRTSIRRLKSTNEITIESTNKFSIVTVCKWDVYQYNNSLKQPTEQPANAPASNQQVTTNNNNTIKQEQKRVKFTPPVLSEIESYFSVKIAEKGSQLNPLLEAEKFEAHYGSINWMVGKNKMVDWKKSVTGWIARNKTSEAPKSNNKLNINTEWNN